VNKSFKIKNKPFEQTEFKNHLRKYEKNLEEKKLKRRRKLA